MPVNWANPNQQRCSLHTFPMTVKIIWGSKSQGTHVICDIRSAFVLMV